MKRHMLVAFVAITCIAIASPAFAVQSFTTTSTTVIGGANFVPSTNVTVSAVALPSTDATNPNTYCVTSVHGASVNQSAGRAYGALSSESGIEVLVAPATVATVACTSTTALPSGFTLNP